MNKIVIAGGLSLAIKGLGDDAQLDVLCQGLRERLPNLEIVCLSRHPGKAYDELHGVKSIKNLDYDSRQESVGRWFRGLNPGDPTDHLREIVKAIDESDLIIIGGDPFIDMTLGFLKGPTPFAALLVTLAKFLQKPIMLYGVNIGYPLQTEIGRELTRYCVTNSDLVTVREEFSRQALTDLGISDRDIHVLADSAFGLNPIQGTEKGKKILEKEDIHLKSDKVVGVSFRHMEWRWSHQDFEDHGAMMANICDYMIENLDVDILFIPQCTYNIDDEYEDDRVAAKYVFNKMKLKERAHRIKDEYPLGEMLSLYRLIDMIVSSKRHSLMFGAVHCVPPVGIGAEGHMKPILDELSLGDSFVNIEEFSPDLLKMRIKQTWDDRESITQRIDELLPALREKALQHAKLAADLIENRQLVFSR
ncbi:polysaccharide pyruvyl transferase family protein [Chloroflexota bacterium]